MNDIRQDQSDCNAAIDPDNDKPTGTKMYRRSDVIKCIAKEMARQWDICLAQETEGQHHPSIRTKSRIDALRILRGRIHSLPVFVEPAYASDAAIPPGIEWAERVRIAGNMTDAPNEADLAMLRLLSDLLIPLAELQNLDEESDAESSAS